MSSEQSKKSNHRADDALPSPNNTNNNKRKMNRKRKRVASKPSDSDGSNNMKQNDKWSSGNYPYPTDYNDHFETPQRAYADIYPLLQSCLEINESGRNKKEAIIYDPYFCTGTAAVLMEQTIKSNKKKAPLPCSVKIHHKKADFYVDVRQNKFPCYDILVTNPPYSSNHKERCLEFAVNQLKESGRPFFLLMPNYVSTKEYFRKITQNIQVVFIAPSTSHPYDYIHPEGTGHNKSPFESVWFCGLSNNVDMKAVKDRFIRFHSKHTSTPIPRWAESLQGLIKVGGVSGEKRKNPRQRKKMRLLAMQKSGASSAAAAAGPALKNAPSSGGKKKDGNPHQKIDSQKQNSHKKVKRKFKCKNDKHNKK